MWLIFYLVFCTANKFKPVTPCRCNSFTNILHHYSQPFDDNNFHHEAEFPLRIHWKFFYGQNVSWNFLNYDLMVIELVQCGNNLDPIIRRYHSVNHMKIEDRINNFLRKLKNMSLMSDDTYKKLFSSGSGPGILYGLPKIHKVDFAHKFQLRPIFAAYNSASYKLAKFLVPILDPFTRKLMIILLTIPFHLVILCSLLVTLLYIIYL